jgi:hypothetical protein
VAESVLVTPTEVFFIEFSMTGTPNPIPNGAGGLSPPDVLILSINESDLINIVEPVGLHTSTLYDGDTQLGSMTNNINGVSPTVLAGDAWRTEESLYRGGPPGGRDVVIEFSSLLDGTIQGRIELTIEQGRFSFDPETIQPDLTLGLGSGVGIYGPENPSSIVISRIGAESIGGTQTTYDFESFAVGSSFSGVAGEFQVQTLSGDALTIDVREGTFSPSMPGLGGHVLAEVPDGLSIADFEFVFDSPIDYFEIYVLDAEEFFQITSDTGLVGTITNFGSGPGGPVRRAVLGSIGGDQFSRVTVDVTNGTPSGGGAGPGPWDLLTFNQVSEMVEVDIDVNPWRDSRCLNQQPVVIFGHIDLDVNDIDTERLTFNSEESQAKPPICRLDYFNDDEYLDLICKFVPGTSEATLSGELLDGTPFQGTDAICAAQ